MVAMYCLYHGRQGLRNIATKIHILTCDLAESKLFKTKINLNLSLPFFFLLKGLKSGGNHINHEIFFDTLNLKPSMNINEIKQRAKEKKINLRYYDNGNVN